MQMSSTLLALGCLMSFVLVSGCDEPEPPVREVQIVTQPVARPAPIVPKVQPLELRDVDWIVVTEQNYEGVLMMLRDAGQEPVLFAVTTEGYQNIVLNQGDVLSTIRQYQKVVALYERSYFDEPCCTPGIELLE